MKLKLITAAAATVLLSAFTIVSTSEKDLVGTWKIDQSGIDNISKKIIDKAVANNPDAEDQIIAQKPAIVSMVEGLRLNMNADHTYASISPQGTKGGKWALTNSGHTLQFTKEDGTIRKDSILESSATRLKVINRDLADTVNYVHP
jgi:hypothetical protein